MVVVLWNLLAAGGDGGKGGRAVSELHGLTSGVGFLELHAACASCVSADLIDNVLLETFSLCMARENYGS